MIDNVDCPELKTLVFGESSLSMTQLLSIGNNPNLLTLSFGSSACSYFMDDWTTYFKVGEFKLFGNSLIRWMIVRSPQSEEARVPGWQYA